MLAPFALTLLVGGALMGLILILTGLLPLNLESLLTGRDITPETVLGVADKTIPGIMEYIRVKYGSNIPAALLSRSVAAVAGKTLIYALPGSAKAVKEYLTEIFTTLKHAIYMLHDLGH